MYCPVLEYYLFLFKLYCSVHEILCFEIVEKLFAILFIIIQRIQETQSELFHATGQIDKVVLVRLFPVCPLMELLSDLKECTRNKFSQNPCEDRKDK